MTGDPANPYALPAGNVQIAFSGGRTSAYMLHEILEANGSLPDRVQVLFQNTGREMNETLDFVQECGERWGVPITWLEYRAEWPFFDIVSHNSASRNGEPFLAALEKRKILPNQRVRWCTIDLKIRTAKRYLMSLGWEEWTNCIGIRADEPNRLRPENEKGKDRWFTWQPLHHAGVTKRDVAAFWRAQPFDLRLPNVNGVTALGNCDGCFLKSEQKLSHLARFYPGRAKWWEDLEERTMKTRGDAGRFSLRTTRKEIREFTERQGDWIFDDPDILCQADEGECTG